MTPLRECYEQGGDRIVRRITIGARESITLIGDVSDPVPEFHAWMRWWQSFLRGQKIQCEEAWRPLRIADLFCGCGGLSLGAAEAARAVGLLPVFELAVDIDAAALSVYNENLHPVRLLARDVGTLVSYSVPALVRGDREAYPSLVESDLRSLVGRIDLLLAGPPCEGHSNLNNRTRRSDPRNKLVLDAVALALALRVRTVVVENVPEARADRHGAIRTAENALRSFGYHVSTVVLDASDYAVAQTRRRLFLLASREAPPSEATLLGLTKRPIPDLRWAIGDLEDARSSPLDVPSRPSPENQRRIAYLFETDSYDLPDSLRPPCHRAGHTYPSVYGRLVWDKPAGTITTGFMSMGRGRFVHPSRPRTLTPHEAARLQGFPDSFRFVLSDDREPTRSQLAKWIGDAVPPPISYAVVLTVLETLMRSRDGT
jgi:DNA (cytosine-5)-methyltransferase 1